MIYNRKSKHSAAGESWPVVMFGTLPLALGGYEGEHHTPTGVIWKRAWALVSFDEIRTPDP